MKVIHCPNFAETKVIFVKINSLCNKQKSLKPNFSNFGNFGIVKFCETATFIFFIIVHISIIHCYPELISRKLLSQKISPLYLGLPKVTLWHKKDPKSFFPFFISWCLFSQSNIQISKNCLSRLLRCISE